MIRSLRILLEFAYWILTVLHWKIADFSSSNFSANSEAVACPLLSK